MPASHTISDGWRAYSMVGILSGGAYTPEAIIHQQRYDQNPHDQNVENMWKRVKRQLR